MESAAIDVDELARSYPPVEADRHLAHLAAISNSFREAGFRLFLVAATAEDDHELRAWLHATGANHQLVVHLIAAAATLEKRVRVREPSDWLGLPKLLEDARRLSSMRFETVDVELDTDQQELAGIAASIEAELGTRYRQDR